MALGDSLFDTKIKSYLDNLESELSYHPAFSDFRTKLIKQLESNAQKLATYTPGQLISQAKSFEELVAMKDFLETRFGNEQEWWDFYHIRRKELALSPSFYGNNEFGLPINPRVFDRGFGKGAASEAVQRNLFSRKFSFEQLTGTTKLWSVGSGKVPVDFKQGLPFQPLSKAERYMSFDLETTGLLKSLARKQIGPQRGLYSVGWITDEGSASGGFMQRILPERAKGKWTGQAGKRPFFGNYIEDVIIKRGEEFAQQNPGQVYRTKSEKEIVEKFIKSVAAQPKSMAMMGYNIEQFDLPFMQLMSRRHGMQEQWESAIAGRKKIDVAPHARQFLSEQFAGKYIGWQGSMSSEMGLHPKGWKLEAIAAGLGFKAPKGAVAHTPVSDAQMSAFVYEKLKDRGVAKKAWDAGGFERYQKVLRQHGDALIPLSEFEAMTEVRGGDVFLKPQKGILPPSAYEEPILKRLTRAYGAGGLREAARQKTAASTARVVSKTTSKAVNFGLKGGKYLAGAALLGAFLPGEGVSNFLGAGAAIGGWKAAGLGIAQAGAKGGGPYKILAGALAYGAVKGIAALSAPDRRVIQAGAHGYEGRVAEEEAAANEGYYLPQLAAQAGGAAAVESSSSGGTNILQAYKILGEIEKDRKLTQKETTLLGSLAAFGAEKDALLQTVSAKEARKVFESGIAWRDKAHAGQITTTLQEPDNLGEFGSYHPGKNLLAVNALVDPRDLGAFLGMAHRTSDKKQEAAVVQYASWLTSPSKMSETTLHEGLHAVWDTDIDPAHKRTFINAAQKELAAGSGPNIDALSAKHPVYAQQVERAKGSFLFGPNQQATEWVANEMFAHRGAAMRYNVQYNMGQNSTLNSITSRYVNWNKKKQGGMGSFTGTDVDAALSAGGLTPSTYVRHALTAGGRITSRGNGLLFSGFDDEYNTIEGLRHGGAAAGMRKLHTEFGSGWQNSSLILAKGFGKSLLEGSAGIAGSVGTLKARADKHLLKSVFSNISGLFGGRTTSEVGSGISKAWSGYRSFKQGLKGGSSFKVVIPDTLEVVKGMSAEETFGNVAKHEQFHVSVHTLGLGKALKHKSKKAVIPETAYSYLSERDYPENEMLEEMYAFAYGNSAGSYAKNYKKVTGIDPIKDYGLQKPLEKLDGLSVLSPEDILKMSTKERKAYSLDFGKRLGLDEKEILESIKFANSKSYDFLARTNLFRVAAGAGAVGIAAIGGAVLSSNEPSNSFSALRSGTRVHGQNIDPEIMAFRKEWIEDKEKRKELKKLKDEAYTKPGDIEPWRFQDIGKGMAKIETSGLTWHWEDVDTLKLEQPWYKPWKDDVSVRLVGIDAPEIEHSDMPLKWTRWHQNQPYGQEALQELNQLVGGKSLDLVIASDPKEKTYGRYLGLVHRPGADTPLNVEMVQKGLAAALPWGDSGSDIFPREIFAEAEEEAVAANRGMWQKDYWKRYLDISQGARRRITATSFSDRERLAANLHLAAAENLMRTQENYEPWMGRYIGTKLKSRWSHNKSKFSAMPNSGTAAAAVRERLTEFKADFASRYDPLVKIAEKIYKKQGLKGFEALTTLRKNKNFLSVLESGKVVKLLGQGKFGKAELMEVGLPGIKDPFKYVRKTEIDPSDPAQWLQASDKVKEAYKNKTWTPGFKKEAQGMHALETGELVPTPYARTKSSLFMEHAPGETLSDQKRLLTDKELGSVLGEIKTAANKGFYNPDIHLGNFLSDPKSGRLSWIDFGFASSQGLTGGKLLSARNAIQLSDAASRIIKARGSKDLELEDVVSILNKANWNLPQSAAPSLSNKIKDAMWQAKLDAVHKGIKFPGMPDASDGGLAPGIRKKLTEFKDEFASRWDPMRKIAVELFGKKGKRSAEEAFQMMTGSQEFKKSIRTALKGEGQLLGEQGISSFVKKYSAEYKGHKFDFLHKTFKSGDDIAGYTDPENRMKEALRSAPEGVFTEPIKVSEMFGGNVKMADAYQNASLKAEAYALQELGQSRAPSLYGTTYKGAIMEMFQDSKEVGISGRLSAEEGAVISDFFEEAHGKGIFHMDFHGENLLEVAGEGGKRELAVIDWALSNRMNDPHRDAWVWDVARASDEWQVAMQAYQPAINVRRLQMQQAIMEMGIEKAGVDASVVSKHMDRARVRLLMMDPTKRDVVTELGRTVGDDLGDAFFNDMLQMKINQSNTVSRTQTMIKSSQASMKMALNTMQKSDLQKAASMVSIPMQSRAAKALAAQEKRHPSIAVPSTTAHKAGSRHTHSATRRSSR